MDDNKKLIKGTTIYALGEFGTKILSFLIVPLYTYYISTGDMGVYDVLISTSYLLIPVITLQVSDAAYKWMISGEKEYKVCVNSTYKILLVNTLVFSTIYYVVTQFVEIPYNTLFYLLLIVSSWYTSILKLARGFGKQKLYAFTGVLFTAVNLSLNFIQLVVLKRGIDSLLISQIISGIICIIFALYKEPQLRVFTRQNDLNLIKHFIIFSLPLIPNYMSWWVINSSDSYIVAFILGASANGILSVAHKFSSFLQTGLALFNSSWMDLAVSNTQKKEEYYTKLFDVFSTFSLTSLVMLIPATKIFICLILNEEYISSYNYVPLYYMGAVFQGFAGFYNVGYLKNNKTINAFTSSVYAAIINIIVDLACIKAMGLHAASLSTFIGFFVMWIVREKHNRKELGIKVSWKTIMILTVTVWIIAYISTKTSVMVNVIMLLFGGTIFLIVNRKTIGRIASYMKRRQESKGGRE